jgi:tungstate transport system ATP-binding protein
VSSVFPLVLEQICFAPSGQPIVDRVCLAIDGRVRTVILGANGAGKSVLMRLMHGLLTPSSGRITWCGASSARAPRRWSSSGP